VLAAAPSTVIPLNDPGYLVREHCRSVGVRLEDQPVEAVEQGPVLAGDGVDVVPYGVVHPPASLGRVAAVRTWGLPWGAGGLLPSRAVAVAVRAAPGHL
jgi:hypothetical protein